MVVDDNSLRKRFAFVMTCLKIDLDASMLLAAVIKSERNVQI